MKLSEFIQRNIGCKVDFDGLWGAQCVDLFRQYCKDVLGIPRTEPVEGAKDLFLKYDSMPIEKKYFVAMKTRDARYGDVIVYGATEKTGSGMLPLPYQPSMTIRTWSLSRTDSNRMEQSSSKETAQASPGFCATAE